jgi:hypothetical protein
MLSTTLTVLSESVYKALQVKVKFFLCLNAMKRYGGAEV